MNIAIVGLGNQGRKRERIAGASVTTTVDPVAPAAQYRRVEDAPLASFDAACVCTPDDTKFECLRYLLSHGKHCLVEKPLLATPAQFDELAELSRRHGATLYTAYNHRFEPHLVRVREQLQAGAIGQPHLLRMFYGNGTARDVRNSPWRDRGPGVITDLGSHLLDLVDFFFRLDQQSFITWAADCFENQAPDHVLFGSHGQPGTGQPSTVLEAALLSWKNHFQLDIFGELGSIHVVGLCKWGPSVWSYRRRVLPSGRPIEETATLEMSDPTWQLEYDHFLQLCERGESNLANDRKIQAALAQVGTPVAGVSA